MTKRMTSWADFLLHHGLTVSFLCLAGAPTVSILFTACARVLKGEIELLSLGWPTGRQLILLSNTAQMASISALLAVGLGAILALWWAGSGHRMRTVIERLCWLPLLLPSSLTVLGWIRVTGRESTVSRLLGSDASGAPRLSSFGLAGSAIVLAITLFPLATHLIVRALKGMELEQLAPARLLADDWTVLRRIILPALRPAFLTGAGLVFVLAAMDYAVPSMLQFNVIATESAAEFSQSHDEARALATAWPLMVTAGMILIALEPRVVSLPVATASPGFISLSIPTWPTSARLLLRAGGVIVLLASLLPLLALSGATPGVLVNAVGLASGDLTRTAAVSLAAAFACAFLAGAAAHRVVQGRISGRICWCTALAALTLPAPLLGIAFLNLTGHWGFAWLSDSPLVLVIALIARFLPLALVAAVDHARAVDPVLVQAALLPDVSVFRRWAGVLLPLFSPGLLCVVGIVLTLSIGEVGCTLVVTPPGFTTVAIRIQNLIHGGASAALSGLCLAVFGLVLIIWSGLSRISPAVEP